MGDKPFGETLIALFYILLKVSNP